jgi:hypothetical protein
MTNKTKRHRRWLHNTGKQVIRIEKTKKRYCPIIVVPELNYYSWKDRLKSLLNFKKAELPKEIIYKRRRMILSE